LVIQTPEETPPKLSGAERVKSDEGRHEFTFDASRVRISDLLDEAAAQTQVLDVETHRVPIDEVIADIYEKWQGERREQAQMKAGSVTNALTKRN
jgi:hypothetical protein